MARYQSLWLVFLASLALACLPDASMGPKARAQECLPRPEGLVSLWSGDGHAADLTGRNPGRIDGEVDFVAGEVGEAFQFGGAGTVVIQASPSLSGEMAGITFAAWVKPQFDGRPRLVERDGDAICGTASLSPRPWSIWSLVVLMDPGVTDYWGAVGRTVPLGTVQFVAGKTDGRFLPENDRIAVVSEAPVPDDGGFHLIAGTYDGETLRVYIDGNLAGERANVGPVDLPLTDHWIGSIPPIGDFGLAAIDEVAVFNRALSAEELGAIVLAGTAGICRNEKDVKLCDDFTDGDRFLANWQSHQTECYPYHKLVEDDGKLRMWNLGPWGAGIDSALVFTGDISVRTLLRRVGGPAFSGGCEAHATVDGGDCSKPRGYFAGVFDEQWGEGFLEGNAVLGRSDGSGNPVVLATGTFPDFDPAAWHFIQLDVRGDWVEMRVWPLEEDPTGEANFPEEPLLQVQDTTYRLGRAGIGCHFLGPERADGVTRYGEFEDVCIRGRIYEDCNANGVEDGEDITGGVSRDVNGNGRPDECECPPAAARTLWSTRRRAEGREVPVYEETGSYDVRIAVSVPAEGVVCKPEGLTVRETVPIGWAVDPDSVAPSGAGNVKASTDGGTVTWEIDLVAGGLPQELGYTVNAGAGGDGCGGEQASFDGILEGRPGVLSVPIGGESVAASARAFEALSDFGSIQHWLVLGPFAFDCSTTLRCAAPAEDQIRRDYLTDGVIAEASVQPREGDTIHPDHGAAAASTGLAPNELGRNPEDVPTWIAWHGLDDQADRIDFDAVYGPVDKAMCYAVTYLDVAETTTVHLGVSSDDSVQVLLDGQEIHIHSIARAADLRLYQDAPVGPIVFEEGRHTLLVKVFEGYGAHSFRVGFVDELGQPLTCEALEGLRGIIQPTLEPPPVLPPVRFLRGASNNDDTVDLSDAVHTLNWLFLGGPAPGCLAAANINDDARVDLSDPVRLLNFLFVGGPAPTPPFPDCGPSDLTVDKELGCEAPPSCP